MKIRIKKESRTHLYTCYNIAVKWWNSIYLWNAVEHLSFIHNSSHGRSSFISVSTTFPQSSTCASFISLFVWANARCKIYSLEFLLSWNQLQLAANLSLIFWVLRFAYFKTPKISKTALYKSKSHNSKTPHKICKGP